MRYKLTTIFALVLSALVSVTCSREIQPVSEKVTREMTFTAEWEESFPLSKTILQPNGKSVWWLPEDKIALFAGPGSPAYEFACQAVEPCPVASFKGEAAQSDTYYAIYPYCPQAAVSSDGVFTVNLPWEQQAVEGTFDTGLVPLVSIAEGSKFTFRNVVGGIKFTISEEGVNAVSISGLGGEALAGSATVVFRDGVPVLESVVDPKTEILLTAPEGGFEPGKNYYAMLYPVSLPNGMTITLKHSGTVPDSKLVSNRPRTLRRGVIGALEGLNSVTPSDGKVRFYVTASSAIGSALDISDGDLSVCKVNVNGNLYDILNDGNGRHYIEVAPSADGKYDAALLGLDSEKWCGNDAFGGAMVPYSQFWNVTKAAFPSYPRYISWSREMGNILDFSDCLSLVNVKIKGSASISSVKVRAIGGEHLSGRAIYDSEAGFRLAEGLDWAVVNCSNNGSFVPLGSDAISIPVFICPGIYSGGLEVTVCDSSHKMMRRTVTSASVKPGQIYNVPLTWAPDSNLLFYEGFDNFVWGGDIMAGEASVGFAPDDEVISTSGGLARDGYAWSSTPVAYDNSGSGFIQSSTWSAVENATVGESHTVSDSYVLSRNVSDWTYMYRCQECPGYLAVGTGNSYRGILRTPFIDSIGSVTDITVSFRLCLQPGFNDSGIIVQLLNAGYVDGCRVDGSAVTPLSLNYKSNYCEAKYSKSMVSIPASASEAKEWHTVELDVSNATDATLLDIRAASSSYGKRGFWIDDITIRSVPGSSRKGTLRLMYWNIQNGMWYDQPNNYNDFVAFVKKYDPDVCVWCEASSIYKDNTYTAASSSSRYLPNNWPTLAKRYDHNYAALGGWRDNYPQEITSKYPITSLLKITNTDTSGKPVAHGAAIQQITVNGQVLCFVTCHMWPQAYGYGVSSADQDRSKAANEGDYYRQFEMQYIIDHTINNPEYASVDNWILLGDMNSRSRKDNATYGYASSSTLLLTQDVILNNTDMKDVIAELFPAPDNFVTSTFGTSRIDYVYVSPALMDKVVNGFTLAEQWNYQGLPSPYVSTFRMPSDHRPIIVDFNL